MEPDGQHTALPDEALPTGALPTDAPPWARVLFDGLSRQFAEVAGEVKTLRRWMAPRLVSRREAARIAGVSTRTIQRYEARGLLQRAPTKTGGAFYAYDDVARLKRMIK